MKSGIELELIDTSRLLIWKYLFLFDMTEGAKSKKRMLIDSKHQDNKAKTEKRLIYEFYSKPEVPGNSGK